MESFDLFKYGWEGKDTVCGWGSRTENTKNIRKDILTVINHIKNKEKILELRLNDAGCGDMWWIRNLKTKFEEENVNYHGYDLFSKPSWYDVDLHCSQLNICEDQMRPCDLILCRDVFIHWPNEFILKALDLFKKSGKYLYSTSYTGEYFEFYNNNRIEKFSMHHSKLNLCSPPFNLGTPELVTLENYKYGFSEKVMCLWKI